MNKLFKIIVLVVLAAAAVSAQTTFQPLVFQRFVILPPIPNRGTSLPATCVAGDIFFKTDATPGQNIYECAATNTWTQQLNSGVGGASTALDNLAAVSINSALLFQTGIDVGSTTKPTRNVFLFGAGTYGSTYIELTGTPTGNRVVTFPDASITVARIDAAQTFVGIQTFGTPIALTSLASTVVNATSPGVGLCHFAGSTQTCTSSLVVSADITDGTVSLADMANIVTASIIGRNTAGTGVPEVLTTLPTGVMPAFTGGDVTSSAGSLNLSIGALKVTTAMIAANAVTLAKMATQVADTVLMNASGSTAVPAAVAVNNCGDSTHALSYSTSSHAYGCQAITATGTPGGSDTQVQFNDGGALGGDAGMTYVKATDTLTVGAITVAGSGAGAIEFTQGSAPSLGTTSVKVTAPALVTSYMIVLPGAAATGISHYTNSSNTVTESISLIVNADITNSTIDLTTKVTGLLPAANLVNSGVMTGDVTTTFPAVTVAKVNGIAYSATAAAHSVEVITTANTTATAKTLPDCIDSGGNHLNFTQSTDAFSCGTTGGSGGGSAGSTLFSAVGTGTGPSNTATETSIIPSVATGTLTIPANTFASGTYFQVLATGYMSLPAIADSLTVKTYCGSTVLGTATVAFAAGAVTDGTFRMLLGITGSGSGASGNFMLNSLFEATGAALTPAEAKILNKTLVAYDFTTSCAFDIKAKWNAAQSGESISGTNTVGLIPGTTFNSWSGDGALISNSASTGTITATLVNAGAHKYWGNNTGSTAAPAYVSIVAGDLPTTLTSGTAITSAALTTPAIGAATGASVVLTGSLTSNALTSGRVPIAGTSGILADDADLTFATDTLTVTKLIGSTSITDSGLTAGRVTLAGTAGLLADDADLTFSTDTLTATKVAFTTDAHCVTAGGCTLGTNALPASSLFVGGSATNNIQITGTSAAARVYTMSDIATNSNFVFAATSTTTTQVLHAGATAGLGVYGALVQADLPATTRARAIEFSIGDAAGAALSTGATYTAYVTVPFACTIAAYNLAVDAGTITVKFLKVATGTAIPTVGSNSISTSGVSISSGTAIHSTTVSDFTTTTVTANDIMGMQITAVATAKLVNGVLECTQ